MGLGKSLTMIALVAADHDQPSECGRNYDWNELKDKPRVGTTLIIVPPPRKTFRS